MSLKRHAGDILHDAEFSERLCCRHSILQCGHDFCFATHLFDCTGERLFDCFGWDHDHAIQVTVDDVSRADGYTVQLNWYSPVYNLAARALVLRVRAKRRHRETQAQNLLGVAVKAVNNRTCRTALKGTGRHQASPERVPM